MAPQDRFVSESTFHVRYGETDMMGIVHHASYLVWFEEGRSAFIRDQGWSYARIEESGYYLAANELTAKYIKAAMYDRLVTVKCWIESYRSRTILFACEVVDTETQELLFSATMKLICMNHDNQITRIPDAWNSWLNA